MDQVNSVQIGMLYSTDNNPDITKWTFASAVELNWNNEFYVTITGLAPETRYYYKAGIKVNGFFRCGEVRSFVTNKVQYTIASAVDLGLSVKWASKNMGADSPEDLGVYYAWGDVNPKTDYSQGDYNWNNDARYRWCDVAAVKFPYGWRMPTKKEVEELLNRCDWNWSQQGGTWGYVVTSRSTGRRIFLPATDGKSKNKCNTATLNCYWTSKISEDNNQKAYYLSITKSNHAIKTNDRYVGLLIRPVYDPNMDVSVNDATDISASSAVVTGKVPYDARPDELFVSYMEGSASNLYRSGRRQHVTRSSNGTFTAKLQDLKPSTKYYYAAYSLGTETAWTSSVKSFVTAEPSLTVKTEKPGSLKSESCLFGVTVSSNVKIKEDQVTFRFEEGIEPLDTLAKRGKLVRATSNRDKPSYFSRGVDNLAAGCTYSYLPVITLEGKEYYGEVCVFETPTRDPRPDAVDLGLSVKWASWNLGANKTEGWGKQYEWGAATENHRFYSIKRDAASYSLGKQWRIPTAAQWTELVQNCDWKRDSMGDVKGFRVTSRTNGNSIFIPASGFYWSFTLNVKSQGSYFMSHTRAKGMKINERRYKAGERRISKPSCIRPVCTK